MGMNLIFFQALFSELGIQETFLGFSVSNIWRKHVNFLKLPLPLLSPTDPLQKSQQDAAVNMSQGWVSSARQVAGAGEGPGGAVASCPCVQSSTVLYVTGQERGDFMQLFCHLHQSNQDGPGRLRRWMRHKCQPVCIPFSSLANCWLGSDKSCVFVSVPEIQNLLLKQKINLGQIYSPECPQTPHYLKGKSLKRLSTRCCRFSHCSVAASVLLLLQPS